MRSRFRQSGFTLAEMAVVLVFMGLVVGFGLKAYQGSKEDNCYDKTRAELAIIQSSIEHYAGRNGHYPLPAARGLGVTDPQFGRAASTGTTVTGGAAFGALPFATLGLAAEYAADCWERKYTYVVTEDLTTIGGFELITNEGELTVNAGTPASPQPMIANAAYAVISHGEDGLGAVARNYAGTDQGWCAGADLKSQNCNTDKTLFAATFNNGAGALNYFDDLLAYAAKSKLPRNCPRDASDPLVGWGGGCQADVPDLNHGGSVSVTNSAATYSGNGTATCNDGTVTISGSCTATGDCAAPGAVGWNSCTENYGSAIPHGGSVDLTDSAGPDTGTVTLVCNNGTINRLNPVCSAAPGAPCALPWGGSTADGTAVMAFQSASVPCGGSCASETRTCTNGTLSGSYTESACAMDACPGPCDPGPTPWSPSCGCTFGAMTNCDIQGVLSPDNVTFCVTASWMCDATPCGVAGCWSDARLKADIVRVASGRDFHIYEFGYRADPAHHRYRGVMAQEVMGIPGAVMAMPNGYYAVDYSKVGVPFERVR